MHRGIFTHFLFPRKIYRIYVEKVAFGSPREQNFVFIRFILASPLTYALCNWCGAAQDTLREDCDSSDDCVQNCCVSRVVAPVFFVVFVLVAQFVLVNVVVAVLMKHLEVQVPAA